MWLQDGIATHHPDISERRILWLQQPLELFQPSRPGSSQDEFVALGIGVVEEGKVGFGLVVADVIVRGGNIGGGNIGL